MAMMDFPQIDDSSAKALVASFREKLATIKDAAEKADQHVAEMRDKLGLAEFNTDDPSIRQYIWAHARHLTFELNTLRDEVVKKDIYHSDKSALQHEINDVRLIVDLIGIQKF